MQPSIREQTDIRKLIAKNFVEKFDIGSIPKGLKVVNLYDNRFRVHVKGAPGKFGDSYFIHATPSGEITYCNPKINRSD